MILEVLSFLENVVLPVNFVCHVLLFLGGLYVAVHSRILPNWVITCLWYIGIAAALNSFTIILEWIYGPSFPMAYTQLGTLTETLLNLNLAFTVGLLFVHTLLKDIKSIKSRNPNEKTLEL